MSPESRRALISHLNSIYMKVITEALIKNEILEGRNIKSDVQEYALGNS